MQVNSESRFKQADLVFVTYGEDQVKDSFLEADRVVEVIDLDNEGSFTAFKV